MKKTYVIDYTPKEIETEETANTVILSQVEWNPYEGKMTNSSMVGAIANMIYGGSGSDQANTESAGGPGQIIYDKDGEVLEEDYERTYYEDGSEVPASRVYYSPATGQKLYATRVSYSTGDSGGRVGRAYDFSNIYDSSGNKIESEEIVYDTEENIIGGGEKLASTSLGGEQSVLGGTNPTAIDCDNLIEGEMKARVYAYPVPTSLAFSLRMNRGRIERQSTHYDAYRDLIQCRLQDPDIPLSPEYPVYSLGSYEWLGDVYDEDGSVVSPPSVRREGTELYVSRKVYGTLDVTYTTKRILAEVVIPQRDGIEGKEAFQAVIFAVFNGGVTWDEIDPSPAVDAESICVEYDEFVEFNLRDPVPKADPKDKIQEWDYCSLEMKEEYYR